MGGIPVGELHLVPQACAWGDVQVGDGDVRPAGRHRDRCCDGARLWRCVCLQRVLSRRERPEQRVRPSQQAQSVSLVHNDCGAGEQRHPEFGENALLDLEDRAVSWQQVAEVAAAGIRPVWHEYGDRYRSRHPGDNNDPAKCRDGEAVAPAEAGKHESGGPAHSPDPLYRLDSL